MSIFIEPVVQVTRNFHGEAVATDIISNTKIGHMRIYCGLPDEMIEAMVADFKALAVKYATEEYKYMSKYHADRAAEPPCPFKGAYYPPAKPGGCQSDI